MKFSDSLGNFKVEVDATKFKADLKAMRAERIGPLEAEIERLRRKSERWGRVALIAGVLACACAAVSVICALIAAVAPTLSLWWLLPICAVVGLGAGAVLNRQLRGKPG